MKFKVISTREGQTSSGKPMWFCELEDEKGEKTKLNIFDGPIKEGDEIEGEIVEKNGYKNFVKPRVASGGKPGMSFVMEKKAAQIAESQDRKNQNIMAAQDRNEWMYAKNNASLLIANHPSFKDMDPKNIAVAVISLATKIKNGEPTEPFS